MYSKNNWIPYLCLEDGQSILVVDYKDPVRKGFLVEDKIEVDKRVQVILPIESVINERYFVNENGIIEERNPYCKHCNSTHFVKKG